MWARVCTSGSVLLATLAALSLLTLTHGQIALPLADTVGALTGTRSSDLARQIVLDIRLPRVVAAMIAGGALGMAGVLMQALFRNPVADAWSLGLLAGGQLGVALIVTAAAFAGPAAVSFLTFFEGPSITLAAAASVAIAALVMLSLGRRVGAITLLVIGLMLGFTAQGLTSVLLHFAARAGGRIYGGWQDASFAGVAPAALPWLLLPILVGTSAAVATAKPLSSLLLGETYARSLGVKVTTLRHAVLAATVLLVAPVVAFCGPVSFVGLIAPHFARALAGTLMRTIAGLQTSLDGVVLLDGERQRVMIARALAQTPRLMVLDEITAFLDLPSRVEIMALLRSRARQKGQVVLLSSHDLDLSLQLSDSVWLLDGAGGFSVGTPDELSGSGAVGRAFDSDAIRFSPSHGRFEIRMAGSA